MAIASLIYLTTLKLDLYLPQLPCIDKKFKVSAGIMSTAEIKNQDWLMEVLDSPLIKWKEMIRIACVFGLLL